MAQAQPHATASATVSAAASANPSTTTSSAVSHDRPQEGLGQGKLAAPAWVIAVCALLLVVGVVLFFVLRHRRAKLKRSYESVAPSSRSPHSRR